MPHSQHSRWRSKGFTLVEVLIVLLIAGLGISLVAPTLINAYEEIKAAAEEQRVIDILEAVKMRSFLRQVSYNVILRENLLKIKETETTVDFQHITFPDQSIIFDSNGFSDAREVKYSRDGREKSLNFAAEVPAN
jgi:prepilin-type N-terminal cleavage/methylation domain-containing protein